MKKILIATLTAGTITAVGGIAVATINQNQIGVPMEENPPITLEDISEKLKEDFDIDYTPKEEETKPVEAKIIDEPVQAKAEVAEPKEETKPQTKPEPTKDEFGNDIDLAYKALCDYVLATENPDQLEGLKIYKPDAYKWLAEAGYKSVMEYLKDPNYISKVHYPRSIYQTYYGLFTSCLNKK